MKASKYWINFEKFNDLTENQEFLDVDKILKTNVEVNKS